MVQRNKIGELGFDESTDVFLSLFFNVRNLNDVAY